MKYNFSHCLLGYIFGDNPTSVMGWAQEHVTLLPSWESWSYALALWLLFCANRLVFQQSKSEHSKV